MNQINSAPVPLPVSGKSGNTTNVVFSQCAMPQRARGYVFSIILLGLPLIAYCLHHAVTQRDTHTWLYLRIPVKPATESGGNRPGRSEATLEVDNHVPGGRFESIHMTLFG